MVDALVKGARAALTGIVARRLTRFVFSSGRWAAGAMVVTGCLLSTPRAHGESAADRLCEPLREACEAAGFVDGGVGRGRGLWIDCVQPLVRSERQRPQAILPLPQVDPGIIATCRSARPDLAPSRSPARAPLDTRAPRSVLPTLGQLVLGPGGAQFWFTGNGVAHAVMPGATRHPVRGHPTPAYPTAPSCPVATVTAGGPLPPRWDLHGAFPGAGADLMTPVEDQLNRGSCWAFAQVGQLEMEYVAAYARAHTAAETRRYAKGLRLSEQYYLVMTSLLTSGPVFSEYANIPPLPIPAGGYTGALTAVGDPTALNSTCGGTPILGLPTQADWPYADRSATTTYAMMQSVPLVARSGAGFTSVVAPTDSAGFAAALTVGQSAPPTWTSTWLNGLPFGFNLDLGNFYWSSLPPPSPLPAGWSGLGDPQSSAYPPPAVHESARYAPLAVRYVDVYLADDVSNAQGNPNLPAACASARMGPPRGLAAYPIVNSKMTPSAEQTACYAALVAPYEALLSQNHPVVVTTRPINWAVDLIPLAPSEIPSYWDAGNPNWTATAVEVFANHPADGSAVQTTFPLASEPDVDQHFVLLIGYDHEKQLFHFKNSWGTSAGTGQGGAADGGTFWMTYDLLFRTQLTLPDYVDGVWDPTGALATAAADPRPAPIPNGNWFGFWSGTWQGKPGVAVLGHFVDNSRGVDLDTGRPVGTFGSASGEFHFQDGSPDLAFVMTRWGADASSYWADFAAPGTPATGLFRLTQRFGGTPATATVARQGAPKGTEEAWQKCHGTYEKGADGVMRGPAFNVVPSSYAEAQSDPYVLPPCNAVAWHVAPTWTCRAGDQLADYVAYLMPGQPLASPPENQIARLCLGRSKVAPACPPPSRLTVDQLTVAESFAIESDGSRHQVQTGTVPTWLDVCFPGADTSCLSDGTCALPTCPAPDASERSDSAQKIPILGSADGGGPSPWTPVPWVRVQRNADTCVSRTYAPTASCPPGYALAPGGTDCLLSVEAPPPTPRLPARGERL